MITINLSTDWFGFTIETISIDINTIRVLRTQALTSTLRLCLCIYKHKGL